MLIILSPAKKLLNTVNPYPAATSMPLFFKKIKTLVQLMQNKSIQSIAALMNISNELAELNYHRYQKFCLDGISLDSYPALFLFQGDVYQGLQAHSWQQETIEYAQNHLLILSGLYGVLRPLDLIQPYRLEMGTHLENPLGNTLYDFWQDTITNAINQILETQKKPMLINLASTEYFKAISPKKMNYPIISINFYEKKNNQFKVIGIHAKKARGVMAKFLMQNQFDDLNRIREFNELGYMFHEATSSASNLNFVRD